ncbi:hypothetical protein CP556_13885 [Natrinema sp. CBA1119]|uniref:hypothetical protein n=1 Tax=Natrinema sp. CBA1119 TaxID=1608465 RepID=UPI000BF2AB42|nr:hypothetical protein [Natrinema sp. CBA1119]PGF17099.1 hypothetical protein CP556_13885 [Natrinema sp. CBA1119]
MPFTKYSIQSVRRGIRNPELVWTELCKYLWSAHRTVFELRHGSGIDIMAEDWDTLIVLDACRYDAFAARNRIDGTLESRLSAGSSSPGWIDANFAGKTHHDTVYVSGNAFTADIGDDVFHAIYPVPPEPVAESSAVDASDVLDPELLEDSYAIDPETVVERALEAHEKHPHKRLIVHFLQPHVPLIGETGLEIYQRIAAEGDLSSLSRGGRGDRFGALNVQLYDIIESDEFDIDVADLRRAYVENLEIVLPFVDQLIRELDGKSVVSADHGELLGERLLPFTSRKYGHFEYLAAEQLRRVPWHVVGSDDRRRIVADTPIESARMDEEEVTEKLRVLGYR